jgi:SAM-dependent methyltransferase
MISFQSMQRRVVRLREAVAQLPLDQKMLQELQRLEDDVAALASAERGSEEKQPLPEFLFDLLRTKLKQSRIRGGVIAEIGGAKNSLLHRLPRFEARFLSIYRSTEPGYIVADITNCPHVPDNSFDAVFSTSVLEHVGRIHDAASEITRILKPGGITLHAVPFSYFFHGITGA